MNDLNKIYEYLLLDNLYEIEDYIFEIIPELINEKNFEQKSKWHCYDVWNHTLAAIEACDKNAEDRLVLLLHDIGKPFSYQDDGDVRHFKNHAMKSAEMAEMILMRLNVPAYKIIEMIELIKMHSSKINIEIINPDNMRFYKRLLKIQLCDAQGYEKSHSKIIVDELEDTKRRIKELN